MIPPIDVGFFVRDMPLIPTSTDITDIVAEVEAEAAKYKDGKATKGMARIFQSENAREIDAATTEILAEVKRLQDCGYSYADIQTKIRKEYTKLEDIHAKHTASTSLTTEAEKCRGAQMAACSKAIELAGKDKIPLIPLSVPHRCRAYFQITAKSVEAKRTCSVIQDYYHAINFENLRNIFQSGHLPTEPNYAGGTGVRVATTPGSSFTLFHDSIVVLKHNVIWTDGSQRGASCWRTSTQAAPDCWLYAGKADIDDIKAIGIKPTKAGYSIERAQEEVDKWISENPKLRGTEIKVVDYNTIAGPAIERAIDEGVCIPADTHTTVK